MADPKEQKATAAPAGDAAGAAPNPKIMMGILGLNMVMMVAVGVVLFLGQKKQAEQQTIDQVVQGAASEHGGGSGHGAAPKGQAHGGGGGGGINLGEMLSETRFYSLGDFTANLAGPASSRYVKVAVSFEVNREAEEEEIKARMPQFRDKVISLLNSKQPADLQSLEGRNALKDEIKAVANTFLKKGKIEGVYFSAFVVN